MTRRLARLLRCVPLTLCAVAGAVWVRSYRVQDVAGWGRSDWGVLGVSASRGSLLFCRNPGIHAGGFPGFREGFRHWTWRPADRFDPRALPDYWQMPDPYSGFYRLGFDRYHPDLLTLDIYDNERWHQTHWSFAGFAAQSGGLKTDRSRQAVLRRLQLSAPPASPQTVSSRLLLVPCWFVVAVTALPPALWGGSRWLRTRRRRGGLCPRCKYDLRATPSRCPECGWAPTAEV